RRGEGLLAARAAENPTSVDCGLDGRCAPEFDVLSRGELVELALAARLGAGGARVQLRGRDAAPFGAWIVIRTVASLALLRTGGLAPFPATLRGSLALIFSKRALEIVPQKLEQQWGRLRGNFPLRQRLFQAQELRLVDLHELTASRRRK